MEEEKKPNQANLPADSADEVTGIMNLVADLSQSDISPSALLAVLGTAIEVVTGGQPGETPGV